MTTQEALNVIENSKQFGVFNPREAAATIIALLLCEFSDKRTKAFRILNHAFLYLESTR